MSADEDDDTRTGDSEAGPPRGPRRQQPPVTIDLAAGRADRAPPTEVPATDRERGGSDEREATKDKAPPPPPPAPSAPGGGRSGRPRTGTLILAGVVGGVIATVLGIAYHASGVVPSRAETMATDALGKIDTLDGSVAALDTRLAAVEAQTAPLAGTGLATLADKVSSLEALENENRARIEKLEAAPATGVGEGGAGGTALNAIETRVAKLESDMATAIQATSAVPALQDRLAAVEASVKDLGTRIDTLAARPPPAVESERAARALAIGMLQQAADKGGPFLTDLAMLKTLGMDNADLAALEPLAGKNTPSGPALQEQFPAVADAILAATSGVDPNAGFFERLVSAGRGLVTVRPTAPIAGDTPEAIVSRMQAAVDKGDLAGALAERKALPADGQAVSAAWAEAADDRVAIDGLVDKLALSVTAPGN
jgi:hypothetical protein